MTKISKSGEELVELSFGGECLQELLQFSHSSKSGDERQVKVDLQRTYGLTIGKWHYERPSKRGSAIKTSGLIEANPDEVFFYRIKSLDKKFQDFILLNFHQGGMFYAARQFLTFHLNSLGFMPNSIDGHRHHFICDFDNSDELVITEKFNVTALDFISNTELLYKVTAKDGEFSCINLNQVDKDKILYFQENLMKLLGDKVSSNYQQANLRLEKKFKDKNEKIQLVFNSDENVNLIEFTVKHTLKLDPTSPMGIKIKELSEEDVSFKVQAELYEFSSEISKPEFSKLLSPNLPCVSSAFFAKPKFGSKLKVLMLNTYREFIVLLLNIIFKLIASPIPVKNTFLSVQPPQPDESKNYFAYRMRP